jgi:hypothetical protein
MIYRIQTRMTGISKSTDYLEMIPTPTHLSLPRHTPTISLLILYKTITSNLGPGQSVRFKNRHHIRQTC